MEDNGKSSAARTEEDDAAFREAALRLAISEKTLRTLIERHEAATVRIGYLTARTEQMKELEASATELKKRAAAAEARANHEYEVRRQAEQEAAELRRMLGAKEAERSKGFLARVFGR